MARLDSVDLRLLRVFVTVVESRGFSAAQTVLNVNTSTISNQITALETRLGVKLCQRGRAGFKLTEDGATIFSETQKLFWAIDGFDMRANALRAKVRGTLNIGLLDNTISDKQARVDALLHEFTQTMIDVQINLEVKSPNELLRDVMFSSRWIITLADLLTHGSGSLTSHRNRQSRKSPQKEQPIPSISISTREIPGFSPTRVCAKP